MGELMLVENPAKRKKSRKGKMPAGLKRYWASRRATSGAKKNPSWIRRAAKRAVRRGPVSRAPSGRLARYGRRYRRNPMSINRRDIVKNSISTITSGAVGGASAIGVDFLLARLPLPDVLKTGPARNFVRALAGVGLAMVADKVKIKGINSRDIAMGPAVVAMHEQITSMLPAGIVNGFEYGGSIGEFDFEPPAITTSNGSIDSGMGMGYDYGVPGMSGFEYA